MSGETKLEVGKMYDLPEAVALTVTRTWYSNDYGDVEVVGPGPLSDRFREIHQDGRAPYLVFADTMRYRMDGERHSLDVTCNCEAVEMGEHPVKDVGTSAAALQDSFISRRQACEYFGIDVDEVDAANARDRGTWAEIADLWQPNGGDA
ncbi:hypothetical protein FHL81_10825 [Agrobacterium tumefaciens]|uniref:hypothetical protein n=1 Tax=Agrobacterium tumefaciens TaxID=358 RepID=UPI0011F2B8AB|nr:hypothetical protein [Agrobacterium tumefaciens]KAA1237124.1 hypothetical protein FHL81_10825 [Agrobacterium tumefaciens]